MGVASPVEIETPDGGRLFARRAGQPGGRPLIFLHGYLLSSLVWTRQLESEALAGYDLVALDLPGCGGSTPGTASLRDSSTWAADLHGVLDALALDRPIVVAWSYAGLVLGDFLAAGGGDRLAAIVLPAAAPLLALPEGPSDDPFFSLIPALVGDDEAARRSAERRFVHLLTAEPLDPTMTDALEQAVASVATGVRRDLIERVLDHRPTYAATRLPVLVLHGEADALLPPVVSDTLASLVPDAELVMFPGLGHAPFLEQPSAFNDAVGRFAGRWA